MKQKSVVSSIKEGIFLSYLSVFGPFDKTELNIFLFSKINRLSQFLSIGCTGICKHLSNCSLEVTNLLENK